MAAIEVVLLLITAVSALIYLWCKNTFSYWQRKGLPYVEPVPFLGNAKNVILQKTLFGLTISDLYSVPEMADKPVIGFYAFHKPALILRDTELLKSVLIKDFTKFSNRFGTIDPENDALAGHNLFFSKNPAWKNLRQKLTPIFTSGKIKQMYPLLQEVGDALEEHLASYKQDANNGFITEVKELSACFTTDMIATIAFGIKVDSLKNPNNEFRKLGRELFQFSLAQAAKFIMVWFLPGLLRLSRLQVFPKNFTDFLRRVTPQIMKERESSGAIRNDLIDALITLKNEAKAEQSEKLESKIPFEVTPDLLTAQAAVFLAAGFETSSSSIAFALHELSKHPEIQQRLRAEIAATFAEEGGQSISYERLQSMEYLGMVVDEILRLYPVLPFLDRKTQYDGESQTFSLKSCGYDYVIPEGMAIYVPVFGLQRDEKYWPKPLEFDPERFSAENKKHINPMTYMPFGVGPRNCIGNRIGLLMVKIGLTRILKNHSVHNTGRAELSWDPKSITLQALGGIDLKFVRDDLAKNYGH